MFRILTLAVLISLTFSGCAKYTARSLSTPSPTVLQDQPLNAGLRIYAKALSRKECKKVLGRNVLAKGYQPVQLFIENHTDKTYLFTKNGVSLPIEDPAEVAKKLHTSTIARATGYGVAALFFSPVFAVPAIVDGMGSAKANDLLDSDYIAKGSKDQSIYPFSFVNMILFIPCESYQSSFAVTLINESTKAPYRLIASIQ